MCVALTTPNAYSPQQQRIANPKTCGALVLGGPFSFSLSFWTSKKKEKDEGSTKARRENQHAFREVASLTLAMTQVIYRFIFKHSIVPLTIKS